MVVMLKRILLAAVFAGLSSSTFAATGSLFEGMFGNHSHGGFGSPAGRTSSQLSITVDIAAQEMTVADEWDTVYTFDVSTGRPGHATPTGTFRPIRMHTMWHSSKYENAPMPWSIFFHGGYAIHGTTDLKHLGHVASHGCVRLDPKNAKLLFDLVQSVGMENTKVVLVGG
jgi:lipoprotein-anchoring transpeptidase ErfK/SrfK